jgi:hypothetical protein
MTDAQIETQIETQAAVQAVVGAEAPVEAAPAKVKKPRKLAPKKRAAEAGAEAPAPKKRAKKAVAVAADVPEVAATEGEAAEGEAAEGDAAARGSAKLLALKPKAFTTYLEANPKRYNTLNRYRKLLAADPAPRNRTKLRQVEKLMQALLAEGVSTRRRKSGTGERVEVQLVYRDTASNRKLERVGQAYSKVVYQGAEFEDNTRGTMRRRRRQPREDGAPKKANTWIESIAEAKAQLGLPAFVIVRKVVGDAADADQVQGHQLYVRASELMAGKKAAAAAAAETPEEAVAVVV